MFEYSDQCEPLKFRFCSNTSILRCSTYVNQTPFNDYVAAGMQIYSTHFEVLHKHRWSSGRILACHAGDPGSIPGRCRVIFDGLTILQTVANFRRPFCEYPYRVLVVLCNLYFRSVNRFSLQLSSIYEALCG